MFHVVLHGSHHVGVDDVEGSRTSAVQTLDALVDAIIKPVNKHSDNHHNTTQTDMHDA